MGPGGNGKSYSILTDIGNLSPIFCTLTNDLSIKQGQQYSVKSYTCDMLL